MGCKTSFYCSSWHLEHAKKYLFGSVRRSKFENLENKIVLEIDYSKAKGNLGKLIVLCAASSKLTSKKAQTTVQKEYLYNLQVILIKIIFFEVLFNYKLFYLILFSIWFEGLIKLVLISLWNNIKCFSQSNLQNWCLAWIDRDFVSKVELLSTELRFEYTYFDNKYFLRTNWKFQGNIKFIKLCSTRVAQLYQ